MKGINIFNEDFRDFINALNSCEVEYLLVGGYSVILYGYSRTTGDMDIWVNPTNDNYIRLTRAFGVFGMSLFEMTLEKFLDTNKYDVFRFGRAPVCIDVLTRVKGLDFLPAFEHSKVFQLENNFVIRSLSLEDLLITKKAAARLKDMDDIENLS